MMRERDLKGFHTDGKTEPDGQSLRLENLKFAVDVYDSFCDETRSTRIQIARKFPWSTSRQDEKIFEDIHSLLNYVTQDTKVHNERIAWVYLKICDFQLLRCNETILSVAVCLGNYKAVQRARRRNWPSAHDAISIGRLKKQLNKRRAIVGELGAEIEENRQIFCSGNELTEDLIDKNWQDEQHFGEIEDFIKITREIASRSSRSISEVQKEARERARLSVAIYALICAISIQLLVTLLKSN